MVELNQLRYIGLYEEPDGSHGVDNSATPGDFLPLPYKRGTLELVGSREGLDPETGHMRADERDLLVLADLRNTAAFGVTMHSHGLDLDGSVTPPTVADFALLRATKVSMGGAAAAGEGPSSAQSTVQAGSSTTVVQLDTGHAARFFAGGAIGCQVVAGSSTIEAREIASVDTGADTVTVKEAFSAAPVEGSPVRGGVTCYLTERPLTHLQILHETRESNDGLVLAGLNGGFNIEMPVGGLGTMSFSLSGSYWARLGSSNVTIPTYTRYQPMLCSPLEAHMPLFGSGQPRVALENSAVTFEPLHTYEMQRSGLAPNTVARMVRQSTLPAARASITFPYADDTYYNAWFARQQRAFFAQAGNLPGGTVLLSAPNVQITNVVPAEVTGGVVGQTVTVEARLDTLGLTEREYSAFRVHYL